MSLTIKRGAKLAAVFAAAAALSACGSGSNNPTPSPAPAPVPAPGNTPPASAFADSASFLAYMGGLVVTMMDMVEPLDIADSTTVPTSDTSEPGPTP